MPRAPSWQKRVGLGIPIFQPKHVPCHLARDCYCCWVGVYRSNIYHNQPNSIFSQQNHIYTHKHHKHKHHIFRLWSESRNNLKPWADVTFLLPTNPPFQTCQPDVSCVVGLEAPVMAVVALIEMTSIDPLDAVSWFAKKKWVGWAVVEWKMVVTFPTSLEVKPTIKKIVPLELLIINPY